MNQSHHAMSVMAGWMAGWLVCAMHAYWQSIASNGCNHCTWSHTLCEEKE